MKKWIYIALLLLTFQGFSQSFADKEKYLIDSLDLSTLSAQDKTLIDSTVENYHKEKSLGKQIKTLFNILNNCSDETIGEKYTTWMSEKLLEEKRLKKDDFKLNGHLINIIIKQGYYADMKGDIKLSLKIYFDAIKITQSLKDSSNEATIRMSIGSLYYGLNEFDNALRFFKEGINLIDTSKFHENLGAFYLHIGSVLEELDSLDAALIYFNRGLRVVKKDGNIEGIANAYFNLAHFHRNTGNYNKALENLLLALELLEEINFKTGISSTCHSIGEIYLMLDKLSLAEQYAQRSYTVGNEVNYPELKKISSLLLSKIYTKKGNHKESLSMYKQYISIRDSLMSKSIKGEALEQRTKHEYEKKKALDDAENDKKIAVELEKNKKQKIITYATFGSLGLVVVFLIFVFNRLQITKKQKNIIEEQKEEVESQRDEIEEQKYVVEEAHKEIKDSINYAKRIQNAILPSQNTIDECLPNNLIIYKPKDVVAGDFYWMESVVPVGNNKNKTILFAAADCTGHGVPGAMISVVCHNALNRAVREYALTEPGKILDKTREMVVSEFEKSEDDVKDGMDIALCSLNGNTLQYAGANNPLWIIRKGEILETKADKQPIGKFDNPLPYSTHTIELQKEDSIYVFTDGYADQFGGAKDKKFGTKRFKELLISIQNKSMSEQQTILNTTFGNWMAKSNSEQLDDVCIIGVKI